MVAEEKERNGGERERERNINMLLHLSTHPLTDTSPPAHNNAPGPGFQPKTLEHLR